MSYTFVTVPISATPAAAIVTEIEVALAAHPSWSFVEEYTQTDVHRIWKCDGADNVAGIDFHLAFVKPATVTSLQAKLFEGYNAATHRMSRPVPATVGSAFAQAGDLSTGATDVLLTDSSTAGAPHAPNKGGLSTSAAHPLHIWVTKSRLVVACQGNSFTLVAGAFPVQAGITDPRFKNIALSFWSGSGSPPQIGSSSPGGGSTTSAYTRTAPAGVAAWPCVVAPSSLLREGNVGSATIASPDPMTARFHASPVAVLGAWGSSNAAPGYRGMWPDAICVAGTTSSGASAGDVIVGGDGTQYVIVGKSGTIADSLIALSTVAADV